MNLKHLNNTIFKQFYINFDPNNSLAGTFFFYPKIKNFMAGPVVRDKVFYLSKKILKSTLLPYELPLFPFKYPAYAKRENDINFFFEKMYATWENAVVLVAIIYNDYLILNNHKTYFQLFQPLRLMKLLKDYVFENLRKLNFLFIINK